MVFVPGFYDNTKFLRKKTQSDGEENSSGMVEENVHINFFESIPDMELGMDGGIEKEGINISPPCQPK